MLHVLYTQVCLDIDSLRNSHLDTLVVDMILDIDLPSKWNFIKVRGLELRACMLPYRTEHFLQCFDEEGTTMNTTPCRPHECWDYYVGDLNVLTGTHCNTFPKPTD